MSFLDRFLVDVPDWIPLDEELDLQPGRDQGRPFAQTAHLLVRQQVPEVWPPNLEAVVKGVKHAKGVARRRQPDVHDAVRKLRVRRQRDLERDLGRGSLGLSPARA